MAETFGQHLQAGMILGIGVVVFGMQDYQLICQAKDKADFARFFFGGENKPIFSNIGLTNGLRG